jgi:nucleotide-binding universal stress UspA family protein
MGFIVVGVDGSDPSVEALKWGMRYAQRHELDVVAVTGYQIPWTIYIVPTFDEADYARRAQEMLDENVQRAQAEIPGVAVESRLILSRPDQALTLAAAGAELLVVGSHGFGALADTQLGSVADAVVHHAPCPVVVHRPSQSPSAD